METVLGLFLIALLALGVWLLFYVLFDIGGDTHVSTFAVLVLLIIICVVAFQTDDNTVQPENNTVIEQTLQR